MTNVQDFGAKGDGKTDDTAALTHAIQRGDGHLVFPRGEYRIGRTLYLPLQMHGRLGIDGSGGTAKLIMAGAGPAIHLVGSHGKTAQPVHFDEGVWAKERMPIVRDIEIVGDHPMADGIRLEGVMQPTFQGVLIRTCRHGMHLANRDRNVLIANCHIYNNSGIGIFLDRVNLHQINIIGNHLSYNKQAGLKIVGSEIRNIQITGNDIEYNFDAKGEDSADVYFDCLDGTVREGTLTSNTVQASPSPGGANVRFIGTKSHPNAIGLFTIAGNLLGNQMRVLDLHRCRGVVLSGNSIYSGHQHSLWAEDCEHLVVGANSFDHNPEFRGPSTDQMVLRGCRNVNLSNFIFQHTLAATSPVTSSMSLRECRNVNINGIQLIQARERGIHLDNCDTVRISGCTIRGKADDATFRGALAIEKNCKNVMVADNFLGQGTDGAFELPAGTGVANGNVAVIG